MEFNFAQLIPQLGVVAVLVWYLWWRTQQDAADRASSRAEVANLIDCFDRTNEKLRDHCNREHEQLLTRLDTLVTRLLEMDPPDGGGKLAA